jgi:hypothetical protein
MATHTSKLPSVPNTAEIDKIKIGQFKSFLSVKNKEFVKLL